jgi:MerR family transcriptional regulator, light-induced transcriptional regulator
MPTSYPISAVAKLTGIPLDTLRAWERRYRTVIPKRVARGRLYSEEQIQKLLLLRRAVEQGHSIGQVAALGDRQLRELLEKSSSIAASAAKATDSSDILAPVLHALDRFDYAGTDREINRLAAAMGSPRSFVHQAALPLMRTVGERWHEGKCSIAQEHMLTNLLTGVLASLVRTYSPSNPLARVLLATPTNERHAFPTLAAAMLIAAGGLGAIYLWPPEKVKRTWFYSAFPPRQVQSCSAISVTSPTRYRGLLPCGSVALRSCIWIGRLRGHAGWCCTISPHWNTNWLPGEHGSSRPLQANHETWVLP